MSYLCFRRLRWRAIARSSSSVRLGSNKVRYCQLAGVVVPGLLCIHTALLVYGASIHSPTLNEPAHLVAGVSYWRFGRFDLYNVNPPLIRLVAAAPLLFAGAKAEFNSLQEGVGVRPEFILGEQFVAANGERSLWLFTLARWACIPFSLLGGYICLRWASELYGRGAGLLALLLWCVCPNIIAFGQLITPDAAATSLGLAACYTFWRWLRQPTWSRALFSGVVLGLAESAKMTFVIFIIVMPLIWVIYRLLETRKISWIEWLRESGMVAARMLVALYVVNLAYLFEGSFTRLGEYHFLSYTLGAGKALKQAPAGGGNRFSGSWLGAVPVPLPRNYMLGIDLQKSDFEAHGLPSYLRGTFSEKGWWYYYLYAMAIKVPLGTWTLFVLAVSRRVWLLSNPHGFSSGESAPNGEEASTVITWRDEFAVLAPAVVIIAFVSSQTGFSAHMRYVLPAFPFVFIWSSRVIGAFDRLHAIGAVVVLAAMAWSVCSSLSVYPHSLSYFNELVGGPTGGPRHLIGSNIEWGQDLLKLKQWLERHSEARPINLAYFAYFDPRDLGIEYTMLGEMSSVEGAHSSNDRIPPGWYAISVNFVRGLPFFGYSRNGKAISVDQGALTPFQKVKPVALVGYSIYIYHITGAGE
jgi:hypothetical protein